MCTSWVLASEAVAPVNIALSSTHVYWVTANAVRRVPKAGGSAETLVSGFTSLRGIASSSTHLYFTELGTGTGSVQRVPLAGSTAETVASSVSSPLTITIYGTQAYWSHSSGIDTKPSGSGPGGEGTVATTTQPALSIAVDDEYVYYVLGGISGVVGRDYRSISQSQPVILANQLNLPSQVVVDGSYVYFTENGGNALKRVSKLGGTVTTLATLEHPVGVYVDDQSAFVAAEGAGQVVQVPKSGGQATIRESTAAGPSIIVGDSTTVYWIERDGADIVAMVK